MKPKQKYQFFIILCIILLLAISTYKISHPHLIFTTKKVTNLIIKQKKLSPCTQWSSLNLTTSEKLPINYYALGIKVDALKTMVMTFWYLTSTPQKEPSMTKKINENNDWKRFIQNQASEINKEAKKITDLYLILSIIYDIIASEINPKSFKELSNNEIEKLILIATFFNQKLIEEANQNATLKNQSEIKIDNIKYAFNKLIKQFDLEASPPQKSITKKRYKFWLNHFNKKIIKLNLKNKNYCNNYLGKKTFSHYTEKLSKIFDYPILPIELNSLVIGFIKNNYFFFFPAELNELNTIEKPRVSYNDINQNQFTDKMVTFSKAYDMLFKTYPFLLSDNGNLETSFRNFKSKRDYIDFNREKNIVINKAILQDVQSTGIQWKIIQNTTKFYRPGILDPLALELLAERISQYFSIILFSNKSSHHLLTKNLKDKHIFSKRFLQVNEIATKKEPSNKIKPKKYFKKTNEISINSFQDIKIRQGYFGGLSSIDLNQDLKIDFMVPNLNSIDIYINKNNNGMYKFIQISNTSQIKYLAAYAIDINYDYWLDIIAISNQGIDFFIQTKPLEFKFTKNIPIKHAVSICVNDIDNDLDLDIYLTRNFKQSALNGRNGAPNKLIENMGNSIFKLKSIPIIESTAFGLGCAILDINNDSKNDIILINEYSNDELFIQGINKSFQNVSQSYNFNDTGSSTSLSIMDFNNDNHWDVFISMIDIFKNQMVIETSNKTSKIDEIRNTKLSKMGNKLFLGKKNGFSNGTQSIFEPKLHGWSWGNTFFDYDNDGDLDFYLTNGNFSVADGIKEEKNIFMINQNNKLWQSNSLSAESAAFNGRAVIASDLNNNGKIDLVVRTPAHIIEFENLNQNKNTWVKIKLKGPTPNTYAIGSIIEVSTTTKTFRKVILPQTGFLSQSPYIKHFGLSNEPIKTIKIIWPNKTTSTLQSPIKLNEVITIKHPEILNK